MTTSHSNELHKPETPIQMLRVYLRMSELNLQNMAEGTVDLDDYINRQKQIHTDAQLELTD